MTALSRMTAKLGDSLKHTCRCSLILYCQAAHNKLFQLQRTKIPNTEVYGRILVAWNCLGPRLKPELVVVWERDSNNKSQKMLKSTLHGRTFDAVVVGGGHNGLVAVS